MIEELNEPVFLGWEEYWAIAVRRRWWILLPLFLVWAAVWAAGWFLPVSYTSESLILVEQQKVPDQYVVPNVTSNLQSRLQSLTEQIVSRTRLQSMIDHLRLYPNSGSNFNSLYPVDQMRSDIKFDLVAAPDHPGDYTAFKLRYSAASPELAQRVNGELAALFIAENDKTQRQLSENTTDFLQAQLAVARANMGEQEARVAAFKEKHLGVLPGQLESNMQILAGLQSQLQNAQQTLDAARQQKLYLESLVQQYQSAQTGMETGDSAAKSPQTLESELLAMQLKLQDLHSRYTDGYPDVVALKEQIAEVERLKKQSEAELAAKKNDGKATNAADPEVGEAPHGTPTPIMQVQSQLKANQLEISNIQEHERDLESQITAYQGRLNLTPETEQELTAISRGYDESKSNYDSLLQKQMQSQLATSLEEQQQGEAFRIIDPPSLPKRPSTPNYILLSLVGLGAGLSLGVGITILLEMINVRVREEKDLLGIVPVGILVRIPHLSTPGEVRSHALRRAMEVGAATAVLVLIALGNVYAFLKG